MSLNQLINGTCPDIKLKHTQSGVVTTTGNSVTVPCASVSQNSVILLSFHSGGAVVPADATGLKATAITDGVSFEVDYTSSSPTNVNVSWVVFP